MKFCGKVLLILNIINFNPIFAGGLFSKENEERSIIEFNDEVIKINEYIERIKYFEREGEKELNIPYQHSKKNNEFHDLAVNNLEKIKQYKIQAENAFNSSNQLYFYEKILEDVKLNFWDLKQNVEKSLRGISY
nr:hypothetical protein GTC16762_32030 [Pigmentibacter ruber]